MTAANGVRRGRGHERPEEPELDRIGVDRVLGVPLNAQEPAWAVGPDGCLDRPVRGGSHRNEPGAEAAYPLVMEAGDARLRAGHRRQLRAGTDLQLVHDMGV